MFRSLTVALIAFTYNVAAQAPVRSDWKKNFKTSLNSVNRAVAMDFDPAGNVYVLGQTWLPDSSKDVIVIKYNPAGQEIWRRIYDNPRHGDDIPFALKVDRYENAWVTGMAKISDSNADFFALKFSADGIPSDLLYAGADKLFDCGTAITTDSLGFAYVGGYETTLDSGLNMLVFKINPEMKTIWKKSYSTANMDIVSGLISDDSSNVYVAANINMAAHTSDVMLMKINKDGAVKWKYIYDGNMKENDYVSRISRDDSGYVYISGYANHVNSRSDIFVLKFDQQGKVLMEKTEYGKIADNNVTSFSNTDQHLFVTGTATDYNVNDMYTFAYRYSKGGEGQFYVKSTPGIRFMDFRERNDLRIVIGTVIQSELQVPYLVSLDTAGNTIWSFTDDTFSGETHMIDAKMRDSEVYFLGDDAGEATGTITLMKYSLYLQPPEEKPKTPLGSKPHRSK